MSDAGARADAESLDMKLEVVVVPVSDVDRAKDFYSRLGWRLDADVVKGELRLIQFTPPGAGCSIQFGSHLTSAPPGSAQGMYLVVSDLQAVRDQLLGVEIQVGDVFHEASIGDRFSGPGSAGHLSGPAPDRQSYGSFASLSDPDGNGWLFQEITSRLPGRVDQDVTRFTSAADLAEAMRRASVAHGEHEKRIGAADPDWPDWYARYMVAEQAGTELPT